MIIGLTGKFCTGKNRVGSLMEKDGWYVIDVDYLGHEALYRSKERLLSYFGDTILGVDGEIDRKKLGSIVFADHIKLTFLEAVTHPLMVSMCEEMIKDRDTSQYPKGTVLNAAVLHKMGLNKFCDMIIYVKAWQLFRFQRAKSTRSMSLSDYIRQDRVQKMLEPKYFFDEIPIYVILNNHGDDRLKRQLQALYKHLDQNT